MKSLVIYDSNFGNTKTIATVIAETVQGDACSVNDITKDMLANLNLIIVGSPINAWNPTARIKTFLKELAPDQLKHMKAAAFDTRIDILISGNAAKKIARLLEEKGASIITEPKAFFVKDKEGPLENGEVLHAREWAQEIVRKYKS